MSIKQTTEIKFGWKATSIIYTLPISVSEWRIFESKEKMLFAVSTLHSAIKENELFQIVLLEAIIIMSLFVHHNKFRESCSVAAVCSFFSKKSIHIAQWKPGLVTNGRIVPPPLIRTFKIQYEMVPTKNRREQTKKLTNSVA